MAANNHELRARVSGDFGKHLKGSRELKQALQNHETVLQSNPEKTAAMKLLTPECQRWLEATVEFSRQLLKQSLAERVETVKKAGLVVLLALQKLPNPQIDEAGYRTTLSNNAQTWASAAQGARCTADALKNACGQLTEHDADSEDRAFESDAVRVAESVQAAAKLLATHVTFFAGLTMLRSTLSGAKSVEGKNTSKKIDALLAGFWRENWPETSFTEALPPDYVKQVLRDMVAAVERSLGKCSVTITDTNWEQCEEVRSRLPSLGKLRDEVAKLQPKAGKPTDSAVAPVALEVQPSPDGKLPETDSLGPQPSADGKLAETASLGAQPKLPEAAAANDAQQPSPETKLPEAAAADDAQQFSTETKLPEKAVAKDAQLQPMLEAQAQPEAVPEEACATKAAPSPAAPVTAEQSPLEAAAADTAADSTTSLPHAQLPRCGGPPQEVQVGQKRKLEDEATQDSTKLASNPAAATDADQSMAAKTAEARVTTQVADREEAQENGEEEELEEDHVVDPATLAPATKTAEQDGKPGSGQGLEPSAASGTRAVFGASKLAEQVVPPVKATILLDLKGKDYVIPHRPKEPKQGSKRKAAEKEERERQEKKKEKKDKKDKKTKKEKKSKDKKQKKDKKDKKEKKGKKNNKRDDEQQKDNKDDKKSKKRKQAEEEEEEPREAKKGPSVNKSLRDSLRAAAAKAKAKAKAKAAAQAEPKQAPKTAAKTKAKAKEKEPAQLGLARGDWNKSLAVLFKKKKT